MKEVMAIIRMNKVNVTKKALSEAGISSMTARKVLGRGKMVNVHSIIDELAAPEEVAGKIAEGLAQGSRLIPKRMLNIIVPDDQVQKVIETIIKVNQEGHSGDGKIFVLPILDVVRVRTCERGIDAI
ncbi:P-II family nitrogen regulator [Thermanaerosceptrum fracticalcis]|uniref:P-II family nitrogen regulator n=1 Tax=Thermanaerosceptrum fracticalcis TaxID=1712410 RepID=A0A7G6DZE2_THEFR|nr:P-II family nitrogen regulator [Thermanaerosceptrum fracticalcis]QNB45196.1 P-II family nitrogen regulator [Thermanaerosceptrum fracticalcis]